MDARNRWQRAIIISLVLNIFLLCSVGLLSAKMFTTEPVQQMIELDLISEFRDQQPGDSGGGGRGPESASTTPIPMVVQNTITSSTPVAVQAVPSLSVDEEVQDQSSLISDSASGNSIVRGGSVQSGPGPGTGSGTGTGNGNGNGSGGIVRPQILSQVHPIYPESARQAGITGTVVIKVQILENGRAGDVSVKQSSGNDLLDASAVAAVYKWRFTPAQEKNTGRAVACYTTVPVVFRLN